MTPEAQRIAIAEACPFVIPTEDYETGYQYLVKQKEGYEFFDEFDPLNDLNTMHEVEKVLQQLNSVNNDPRKDALYGCWVDYERRLGMQIHATATQRAEAFLRTIGKWDDSK